MVSSDTKKTFLRRNNVLKYSLFKGAVFTISSQLVSSAPTRSLPTGVAIHSTKLIYHSSKHLICLKETKSKTAVLVGGALYSPFRSVMNKHLLSKPQTRIGVVSLQVAMVILQHLFLTNQGAPAITVNQFGLLQVLRPIPI